MRRARHHRMHVTFIDSQEVVLWLHFLAVKWIIRLPILFGIEIVFNKGLFGNVTGVNPSTPCSSAVLQDLHFLLLVGLHSSNLAS